jgi:hypothetical protein
MLARTGLSQLALIGAFALMLGTAPTARAQAQDPMVGNWKFNAAKSTSTSPLPKKRDLAITQKGADLTVAVDEVSGDGTPIKWTFTTKGDGKPVPVTGWAAIDTATSTLKGGTGKTVYTKGGKPAMESNTEVSADGKVLMIKGTRVGADGKTVPYSSHYDRQ